MTIDIEKLAYQAGLRQDTYEANEIVITALCKSYAAKVLEDKEREIAELEIQNVLYKDDELEQQIAISELQAKNSELSASINNLREALEFYADKNEWSGHPWKLKFNSSHIDADGFELAQQALSKTPAQRGEAK